MNQQSFSLTSVTGLKLYGHIWQSNSKPLAVVVLLHGFSEHCLRYSPYIELFDKENIAFIGIDHIGHGHSDGKRGAIYSYEQLLNDIDLLIDKAEAVFPDSPKFLYGHSMGGNIALNYLLQRSYPFKGALISAPWLKLTSEPNLFKKACVRILQYICPNMTIASNLDTNFISTQEEEVDAYIHDPLNHGRISFRLLAAISRQGLWAMNHTHLLKTPTLLIHGNKDQITSHVASKQLASKHPYLIKYLEFDGMYHEIHNDTARKKLAEQCIKWIKEYQVL